MYQFLDLFLAAISVAILSRELVVGCRLRLQPAAPLTLQV